MKLRTFVKRAFGGGGAGGQPPAVPARHWENPDLTLVKHISGTAGAAGKSSSDVFRDSGGVYWLYFGCRDRNMPEDVFQKMRLPEEAADDPNGYARNHPEQWQQLSSIAYYSDTGISI